ncbi:MAG: glycosyltransferase family 39 protein [Desulfomonilaceae bacterium]|nr:glycosyltransferase family 39 protein [Desulfomonilaceae bacterium]
MTVEQRNPFVEIMPAVQGIFTKRRAVVLALVGVAGFCLIVNSSWKVTPDSALYLELGESLALGKGYVFNGERHTYVPPGYPGMIALIVKAFGTGFLNYRILTAVLGILTAFAGWLLTARLCGRDIAFIAGGLFAINHTLLHNAAFTTSDVPFALVSLLALNAVVSAGGGSKRVFWTIFAGFLLGLPALIRVNGWGIPPAAAIYLFTSWTDRAYSRRAVWIGVVLLLSVTPGLLWELYKANIPGSFHEGSYLTAVGGRDVYAQIHIILHSAWGYVAETSEALSGLTLKTGVLELVILVPVVIGMAAACLNGERFFLSLTVIQFGGLLLSPAGSRYIILLLPGLYVFFFFGITKCWGWIAGRARTRRPIAVSTRRVIVGTFIACAVFNVGHNMITIVGARSALEHEGAESSRDLPFFEASRWLRANAPDAVILTMHPRALRYLSGLRTVELVRSGFPEHEVWVNEQDKIRDLVTRTSPTFLFSDSKNREQYRHVMAAIESLGWEVREIAQVGSSDRFRLWMIRRQSSP